jgi:large subunit ribosomal protein L29
VQAVKSKEFLSGIAGMSLAELNDELVAAKKELFNLRFQNATNQLDNTSRIKEVRRNIARIQTAMSKEQKAAN